MNEFESTLNSEVGSVKLILVKHVSVNQSCRSEASTSRVVLVKSAKIQTSFDQFCVDQTLVDQTADVQISVDQTTVVQIPPKPLLPIASPAALTIKFRYLALRIINTINFNNLPKATKAIKSSTKRRFPTGSPPQHYSPRKRERVEAVHYCR
jgi:hypothetical protein